jgi:hypothetical protein
MVRPQPGAILSPDRHIISIVYHVADLGLNAMSIAKIAAMIAGLAEEKNKFGQNAKMNYLIGFGARFWSLVFHANLPKAFNNFLPSVLKKTDPEEIGGDFFLALSSENSKWNQRLLTEIETNLNELTEVSDRFEGRSIVISDLPLNKKALIQNEDPEFSAGCFILRFSFSWKMEDVTETGLVNTFVELVKSKKYLEKIHDGGVRALVYQENNRLLVGFLSGDPENLESVLEETIRLVGLEFFLYAKLGSYAFVPSVDILTGLRMGGLRMGDLSPTAKFKINPI